MSAGGRHRCDGFHGFPGRADSEKSSQRVYLFYGARCPEMLIYRPQVESAGQRSAGLTVHYFAEEDYEGTDCQPGLMDAETVLGSVANPFSLTYYLAGPPAMIRRSGPG